MSLGGSSKRMSNLLSHDVERSPQKKARQVEIEFDMPSNSLCNPMLTDMYQISMVYAHWLNEKVDQQAVFDLFFRKCPFNGEFCVFAGLDECIKFISTYKFTESDIEYLKELLPNAKTGFFDWLLQLDCSTIKIYAIQEGTAVFAKTPILRIEGGLGIGQLLETTLLNCVNYASLVCTNAARMKIAAGPTKSLMEFGLRRAQGPDGGFSASKYSYMGGFDGTSNVLAGKVCDIPVKGTHAHAYVMAYTSISDLNVTTITTVQHGKDVDIEFVQLVLSKRAELGYNDTNEGELAAFISYAQAYPTGLLALVDTYDTVASGVPNFICVSLALKELGYDSVGIRLDSGDLAYLSVTARTMFRDVDERLSLGECFVNKSIVASNDLSEDVILSLNLQNHDIDVFGIGTNLVTCLKQPALGCVYKLVEINKTPRIKLSQDLEKLVIPGKKSAYRLYGENGRAVVDVLQHHDENPPQVGVKMLVRHPFEESKRAYITPYKVKPLLTLVWDGIRSVNSTATNKTEQLCTPIPSLDSRRSQCLAEVAALREDHKRSVNPTPYKVSVSESLYKFIHELWQENAPIQNL